ncbi:hypothetical protein H1S01_15490 [Heliobacterium chlorum]|uniref:Uncharacterized protein n=1 Tax=Heliobacterium chlorum TaxID=2698 RepID=A0ABR7T796_HELCL|nr:DUF6338 family protein [Heliobacterium chlorum]MBC9785888.1 hypothetical protein [Heliobacterium chlorum]
MTQNIINILLFIMPGTLVNFIAENIFGNAGHKKSDFEKLLEGVFLSLPITAVTYCIIVIINYFMVMYFNGSWWTLSSITEIEEWLKIPKHLILYAGISTLISFLSAKIAVAMRDKNSYITKKINNIRSKLGMGKLTGAETVWDDLVNNDKDIVVTLVTKDGVKYKGFLATFSESGDKPREILIERLKEVQFFEDYFDFENIDSVYFNFDSGTTLLIHDMSRYELYKNANT